MTHVILKPMGLQTPTLISSLFLQHLQHLTSRPCLQELSKQLHYEGVGEKSRPIDLAAGSLALIFFLSQKSRFTALKPRPKMMLQHFTSRCWQLKHFWFLPLEKDHPIWGSHIFADGLVNQPPTSGPDTCRSKCLEEKSPKKMRTDGRLESPGDDWRWSQRYPKRNIRHYVAV